MNELVSHKLTEFIQRVKSFELQATWFEWRSKVPKCESSPISAGNVDSALFLKFDAANGK